jgi:uncharacterized glyoxalase superfamily protein PhnB
MRVSVDVVVSDVNAAVEFYRRLGLDVPDPWEQDGVAHHVGVPESGVDIGSREMMRWYNPRWDGPGVVLIFNVEDREAVDEKFNDMTSAGYVAHLAPFDAFWGARYAIVDDPDGNHVGIMSPQDKPHSEASTL